MAAEGGLLRSGGHGHHRVGFAELFFDLVFVFAITQLSHGLLAHLSLLGVAQTAVMMVAVWWLWIYTAWATNWLDPERVGVRLLLFVMMLGGLMLAAAIPQAFEERGWVFALAYVAMQLGRTLFVLLAIPRANIGLRMNFWRILVWFAVPAPLWLAGAWADPALRLALWAVAAAVELMGPAMRFAVPGLGASRIEDWRIEGGHMAERCALFVIIALGESVLVTGATAASHAWDVPVLAAFVVAVSGSVAMWWLYFNHGAELGTSRITATEDPGRLARAAYTYLHLPVVAGVIVAAVGDEMVLAHPAGHASAGMVFGLVGGPVLFLAGLVAFKRVLRGWWQPSHYLGFVGLLALVPASAWLSPLAIATGAAGVLIVVAAWETWSLRREG